MKNIFWQKLLAQVFLFFKGIWQRQTVGARAILIDDKNRVLLVRQFIGSSWQFPGGGVDPGESFAKAAKRETYEETGYQINGEMKLHSIFHNIEATNRDHLGFFIAHEFERKKQFKPNREITEIAWFEIDNLPDNIAKSAKRRIDEIFDNKDISENW